MFTVPVAISRRKVASCLRLGGSVPERMSSEQILLWYIVGSNDRDVFSGEGDRNIDWRIV